MGRRLLVEIELEPLRLEAVEPVLQELVLVLNLREQLLLLLTVTVLQLSAHELDHLVVRFLLVGRDTNDVLLYLLDEILARIVPVRGEIGRRRCRRTLFKFLLFMGR